MNQYFNKETLSLAIATASFIALLIIVFFIYRYLLFYFKRRALKKPGKLDVFVLDLFKIPSLWITYWILIKIFAHIFLTALPYFPYLAHISTLLLIFSVAWIAVQFVKAGSYYLQLKLKVDADNNLIARKSLTQIKVFQGIINTTIGIIAFAVGLLTFHEAQKIGVSILTSAGILGIIVGFAAQKSLGMILAGIQLAITQPIRLDDVVIVENEWGNIEEITLTYVVVKIWDQRRLILPVTYFLEKPFQNWTRTNADIIGTIFLYVDYSFPVESIRSILPGMLKEDANWDGRVVNVQVTNTTHQYKEIRILLSSSDSSKNWDLRAAVREKLIDYVTIHFPDAFAKIRIMTV